MSRKQCAPAARMAACGTSQRTRGAPIQTAAFHKGPLLMLTQSVCET